MILRNSVTYQALLTKPIFGTRILFTISLLYYRTSLVPFAYFNRLMKGRVGLFIAYWLFKILCNFLWHFCSVKSQFYLLLWSDFDLWRSFFRLINFEMIENREIDRIWKATAFTTVGANFDCDVCSGSKSHKKDDWSEAKIILDKKLFVQWGTKSFT